MSDPITFRRRFGRVAAATACAAALCPVLLWHARVLPLGERQPEVVRSCLWLTAALGAFALVGVARALRERAVLDAEGLTLHGLLRKRTVPWASVAEAAAPWGLYADVPLALKLRGGWGGLLGRLLPRRVCLTGHWRDHERLVREVVARVPHAAVNRRLRAWLAEPGRVPWHQRLPLLACLAASVAASGYALWDALAEGLIGLVPGGLVAASAVPCALVGGPVGREWRPKLALVAGYALLALSVALAATPLVLHGLSDWMVLLLAACLGWAAATFAVCLPWAPSSRRGCGRGLRAPRGRDAPPTETRGTEAPPTARRLTPQRVVGAAYAGALAAAISAAWLLGVRERVPVTSIGPLRLAGDTLAWSPDASRLGLHTGEPGREGEAFLLIERPSLRELRLPLSDVAERLYLPQGRHALYLTCLFRGTNGLLGATRKLWAWDPAAGRAQRLPVPQRLRIAKEGLVSPDGQRAVFLGLDEAPSRWHLFLLRLDGLALSRLESAFDFSRFRAARWACDGALLLTEQEEGKRERPDTLALWALAHGATVPERFYETEATDLWDRYSPDMRWVLVALFGGGRRGVRYELVDLRTRASRPLGLPGSPKPHEVAWSPDGAALAYAVPDVAGQAVVRLDPATGQTRRVPLGLRGEAASIALSCGGRFAACTVRTERATRVRVADLDTGRRLTLRRPMLFSAPIAPTWSPAGHTLAVAGYDYPLPPAPTVRIRLLDFDGGW